jgi:hypothetical protein
MEITCLTIFYVAIGVVLAVAVTTLVMNVASSMYKRGCNSSFLTMGLPTALITGSVGMHAYGWPGILIGLSGLPVALLANRMIGVLDEKMGGYPDVMGAFYLALALTISVIVTILISSDAIKSHQFGLIEALIAGLKAASIAVFCVGAFDFIIDSIVLGLHFGCKACLAFNRLCVNAADWIADTLACRR